MSRSGNDGGFAKSAGTATARGIALIAVAVVLGFVLLSSGLDDDTDVAAGNDDRSTTTTAAEGSTDGSTPGSTTATTSAVPKPPNEVRVLVANGSGVQGAAGNVPTTVIYFAEGFQREAAAVATAIGADPATVQALPNPPPLEDPAALQEANILIVLGPDLAQPGA